MDFHRQSAPGSPRAGRLIGRPDRVGGPDNVSGAGACRRLHREVCRCSPGWAGYSTRRSEAHVRSVLDRQLADAFFAFAALRDHRGLPVAGVQFVELRGDGQGPTIDQVYQDWVATALHRCSGSNRMPGWALAGESPDPADCRVLDIGAGTGRNAIPLARRGHPSTSWR